MHTDSNASVVVISAVALTDEQKETISKKIRHLVHSDMAMTFVVDAELIGGLRVTIGDWRFDGSLKKQLNQIKHYLLETKR